MEHQLDRARRGVVELLRPLVGYARGAGIDVRWVVIDGTPEFFDVTKRIHNRLHSSHGDGGRLDDEARRLYEEVLAANLEELAPRVREGDVVILHDPQPAGMAPALSSVAGALIWRCHVGVDDANDVVRETWDFLLPYVRHADAAVFSREAFVWEGLDRERVVIITPTIDVFTPKNEDLAPQTVLAVLQVSGLVAGEGTNEAPSFQRQDGSTGRVERRASIVEEEPVEPEAPLVVQVSRWVAEAMWKARPVVASGVGGIREQIVHGESGIVVDDPRDLRAFGIEITGLLRDPERAELIGRNARRRVHNRFLSVRSLLDYLAVIKRLLADRSGAFATSR